MCVCQCSDDEFSVCVSVYLSCMSYDVFFPCINFITAPTLEFSPLLGILELGFLHSACHLNISSYLAFV